MSYYVVKVDQTFPVVGVNESGIIAGTPGNYHHVIKVGDRLQLNGLAAELVLIPIDELNIEILLKLTYSDIINISRTNHEYSKLCTDDTFWFKLLKRDREILGFTDSLLEKYHQTMSYREIYEQLRSIAMIDRLSLDDLQRIKNMAEDAILKKQIESEVEEHGFAFSKYPIICNYSYQSVNLMVDIMTWDKEDKDDENWRLRGVSEESQEPWFDDYKDYNFDLLGLKVDDIEETGEWKWGDWDDPIRNTGTCPIYLYKK